MPAAKQPPRKDSAEADIFSEAALSLKGTFEGALARVGVLSVAAFTSCCPSPAEEDIRLIAQGLKPALLKFIAMVRTDFRGRPTVFSMEFVVCPSC